MADAMDRVRAAEERYNAVIEHTTQLDRHVTTLQISLQNLERETAPPGQESGVVLQLWPMAAGNLKRSWKRQSGRRSSGGDKPSPM